jgi:phosphoribosylformimino-5-aminoimidazole carboxamide ribotide isomerase
MLIIPTIPIAHGVCGAQIASAAHEVHHAGIVGRIIDDADARDIYSQSPVDRARLFRKENAKMLHLHFLDRDPWDEDGLSLIRAMREAVDIPFGLAPTDDPPPEWACQQLFDAGIYRVWLPDHTPEDVLFAYGQRFKSGKIIPSLDPSFDFESRLSHYRANGIERAGIDLSHSDTLEASTIDWDRLRTISQIAIAARVRLTALRGVRGYRELKRLQDIGGGADGSLSAFDSLVLGRALNENRFPCQLIWREMEAEAALETTPMNNLWSNPLEGKAHI